MNYYIIRVMIILPRQAGLPEGERINDPPRTEHEAVRKQRGSAEKDAFVFGIII